MVDDDLKWDGKDADFLLASDELLSSPTGLSLNWETVNAGLTEFKDDLQTALIERAKEDVKNIQEWTNKDILFSGNYIRESVKRNFFYPPRSAGKSSSGWRPDLMIIDDLYDDAESPSGPAEDTNFDPREAVRAAGVEVSEWQENIIRKTLKLDKQKAIPKSKGRKVIM